MMGSRGGGPGPTPTAGSDGGARLDFLAFRPENYTLAVAKWAETMASDERNRGIRSIGSQIRRPPDPRHGQSGYHAGEARRLGRSSGRGALKDGFPRVASTQHASHLGWTSVL
jgi:hypothetical protein